MIFRYQCHIVSDGDEDGQERVVDKVADILKNNKQRK